MTALPLMFRASTGDPTRTLGPRHRCTALPHGGAAALAEGDTPRLRTDIAHSARVQNYLLGGKDNFAADREAAARALEEAPELRLMAHENQRFARAATTLAESWGIRQFVDLGAGLPGSGPAGEIREKFPAARCAVYVDNDPMVLAHVRASARLGLDVVIDADLRSPGWLTACLRSCDRLDLSRPVAVLATEVLHYLGPGDSARTLLSALMRLLAPGSMIALTHAAGDLEPHACAVARAYRRAGTSLVTRSHAEVVGLFGGLELLTPGVVPVAVWRPGHRVGRAASRLWLYAGLAVKR